MDSQTAGAVLMVRPASFGFNAQTAASNAFQRRETDAAAQALQGAALAEFDGLARALSEAGVEVIVGADTAEPVKPDAIFPNNWVSFHADGTVVLYPMLASNRRAERRENLLQQVSREGGFHVSRTVDLSHHEASSKFLEGTGSLVLDRTARLAYACSSPRTDLDVLGEFAQQLDYRVVSFEAFGSGGTAIYHTNVMMSVGVGFAVICSAAIAEPVARSTVAKLLRDSGRTLVEISMEQMQCFAANLLELRSAQGPVIAISAAAWASLDARQRRVLESFAAVIPARIPTIERIGGGSVRCMLAEIHLPRILGREPKMA
jgi:hypothetical protein